MQVYVRFKVTERKDDRRQIKYNCLFGSVPDIIKVSILKESGRLDQRNYFILVENIFI